MARAGRVGERSHTTPRIPSAPQPDGRVGHTELTCDVLHGDPVRTPEHDPGAQDRTLLALGARTTAVSARLSGSGTVKGGAGGWAMPHTIADVIRGT